MRGLSQPVLRGSSSCLEPRNSLPPGAMWEGGRASPLWVSGPAGCALCPGFSPASWCSRTQKPRKHPHRLGASGRGELPLPTGLLPSLLAHFFLPFLPEGQTRVPTLLAAPPGEASEAAGSGHWEVPRQQAQPGSAESAQPAGLPTSAFHLHCPGPAVPTPVCPSWPK